MRSKSAVDNFAFDLYQLTMAKKFRECLGEYSQLISITDFDGDGFTGIEDLEKLLSF